MQQGTIIQSVEIYKLFIPLKEPFVISLGPINDVQNVVVIVRTKDGCESYGECSPYLSINSESVDTCFKSAFDIALHDIAGQHSGISVYQLLGGEKNKVLETDMTVSIGDPEKMKRDAILFKEQGFPAIKVKLGARLEKDVSRIKAIREG